METKMEYKLSRKENEYARLRFEGKTQREAWGLAGYSTNYAPKIIDVNACNLEKKNKIQIRLKELRDKADDESIMTVIERKKILSEIAQGNLIDYQETGADGSWLNIGKDSPNTRAIAELTSRTDEKDSVITKVKLHNPMKAIDLLNKMDNLYSDTTINIDNRKVIFKVGKGYLEATESKSSQLIDDSNGLLLTEGDNV